jgi:hypothetical protein
MNNEQQLNNLANVCQLASFAMIFKETTNQELMSELRLQDQILAEQTNVYLKTILNKLNTIEQALIEKGILNEK